MRDVNRPVLHLIDGSGYIFRAYFAIRHVLSSPTGVPTNAVVGFAKMLNKLLRQEQPKLLGMAFDTGNKNFRHDLYSKYKAQRQVCPEDLVPQFPLIHQLVQAMGIPILTLEGYEADDVLATLAGKAIEAGYRVVVVSGDKDLMQLVGEHLCLFDPLKDRYYDRDGVVERFGVPPEHVVDILGLAGDPSDNIPGVPQVGPVSAAKWVCAYGDVEAIIAALAAKPKRKANEEAVLQHIEQARLCKRLAQLVDDAPIALDVAALAYSGPQTHHLGPFLRSIGAWGLLKDFGLLADGSDASSTDSKPPKPAPARETPETPTPRQSDLFLPSTELAAVPSAAAAPADPTQSIDYSRYKTIFTQQDLDAVVQTIHAVRQLSVDLETTSLQASAADIVGVALCVPGHDAVYVPVGHRYPNAPAQLPEAAVLDSLRAVLQDPKVVKWGQNLKYDFVVFRRAGIHLAGIKHDAMLAAYVIDPARNAYGMDTLAREYLHHQTLTYDDMTGTGKKRIGFAAVQIERATAYAAEDAEVALRLGQMLYAEVKNRGLKALYEGMEIPLVPVLATMEAHGVQVDTDHLGRLAEEFNNRLRDIENAAYAEIGEPINLGSPKQLSQLFFTTLGYPVIKKTKTGYSTDQEVLETLARTYTLPGIILEHRLLSKLKSTYIDALPRMVNVETGRLHTHFNQTGTATGRLSSSDPNLQNIPIRGDDGVRIRAAFTAPAGCEIISADYSQVELRVMAHLSGDPHFIEAFTRNEDIHRRTAMEILTGGAEPSQEMRRRAKAINFGILYGLSEYGLSRQLNIPRLEAQAYIAAYFARYSRIRTFLDETIDKGRTTGYVSTLLGRRRYLPFLRSTNGNLRHAAERIAMNTPVQGTAADLIKLAMVKVAARLTRERLQARLVLQVHDELVLESPTGERDAVTTLLKEEMAHVMQLRVPIVVDVGHGANWAQAH